MMLLVLGVMVQLLGLVRLSQTEGSSVGALALVLGGTCVGLAGLSRAPLRANVRLIAVSLLTLAALVNTSAALVLGKATALTPATGPAYFEEQALLLLPKYGTQPLATLLEVESRLGTEAAIDRLVQLFKQGSTPENSAHEFMHAIGQFSVAHYGDAGVALSHCKIDFGSACYHGVLIQFVSNDPTRPADDYRGLCTTPGLTENLALNGCWHGLGHGFAKAFNYDLPRMIASCEQAPATWVRQCTDGAFMENILTAQAGDLPGYLKPEQPAWPCVEMPSRHLPSCYREQVRAITTMFKQDWSKVAAVCAQAPTQYQIDCYDGMGGEVDGTTMGLYEKSKVACATAPSVFGRDVCIYGTLKLDRTRPTRDKIPPICNAMEDPTAKDMCTSRFGARLSLEVDTAVAREQECTLIDLALRKVCVAAAARSRYAQ